MSAQMLWRAAPLVLATLALASCTDSPTEPAPVEPTPISLAWQQESRDLVSAGKLSALAAGRVYAAVGVAEHRAVKKADLEFTAGTQARIDARRGAVAGASAVVLSFFFPTAAAALEQKVTDQGNAGAGGVQAEFTRGVVLGRAEGETMRTHVSNDKFTAPWNGTIPTGPNAWVPSALPPGGGMLSGVTPYYLTSASQFRPTPPPAFGSAAFDTDLSEVLTRSQGRTAAELALALYWDSPAGTPTPIGLWNNTAAGYVTQEALDERAATEVFAVLQAAMFDALIGCWEAKYHYWLLRPSHANPAIPLAFTLPNFPAYPSGHSCASAAAGQVLTHFFPEHTAELATLVSDAGLARIVAGIHYRFDITAGAQLGKQVAEWAIPRGAP